MKRKALKTTFVFALAVLAAAVMGIVSSAAFLPGDMNRDGKVTSADARTVLRIAARLESVENYVDESQTAGARLPGDMNRDGKVTSQDARIVLRVAAKLESVEDYMDNELPVGSWGNEKTVYTFNADGSGFIDDKETGTGVAFTYEKAKANALTMHIGSAAESEEVAFEMPDENTLVLTYADNNVVTLTRVAEKSVVGAWEDDKTVYTFNTDGSGSIEDKESGTGAPFDYEIAKAGIITLHLGSAEECEEVGFETSDENTLILTFEDSRVVTLTRVAEKSVFGSWENEKNVYTFNADGSGFIDDKETGTGIAFTYEKAKANALTMHIGSAGESEEVAFETPNENTLVLTYADNNVVTLTRVAERSVVGAWEDDKTVYTFNADGNGFIDDKETGTGVAFTYEKAKANALTMHIGSAGESEEVAFETPDDNTLVLTYADNNVVTLTRVAERSVVGSWENEKTVYTFNADGSGSVEDRENGTAAPFAYEIAKAGVITLHLGSADASEEVAYETPDGNTLILTFADSCIITLTLVVG